MPPLFTDSPLLRQDLYHGCKVSQIDADNLVVHDVELLGGRHLRFRRFMSDWTPRLEIRVVTGQADLLYLSDAGDKAIALWHHLAQVAFMQGEEERNEQRGKILALLNIAKGKLDKAKEAP